MVMVDSSVWVDFFHKRPTPAVERLKELATAGNVTTGDYVLHEVLRGFDDDRLRARVLRVLDTLTCHDMLGAERALLAANRYRELRRRGITVRKANDSIIASYCIEANLPLLTSDWDFAAYAKYMGLQLVEHDKG